MARERLGDRHERWLKDPQLATIDGEVALLRGLMERLVEGDAKPEEVADMAERVVRAVDVLLKHREKFGLTMETFNRVTSAMGVSVARHVASPEVLAAIQREWDEIRLT